MGSYLSICLIKKEVIEQQPIIEIEQKPIIENNYNPYEYDLKYCTYHKEDVYETIFPLQLTFNPYNKYL